MNDSVSVDRLGEDGVRIVRSFAALPARVFDAHFNPALVQRWMLGPPGWSMPTCEVAPVVGARIRSVWTHADGRSFGLTGEVLVIDRPHRAVHVQQFDGEDVRATIETRFAPEHGGTRLEMVLRYPSAEACPRGEPAVRLAEPPYPRALATNMAAGMGSSFSGLALVLADSSFAED